MKAIVLAALLVACSSDEPVAKGKGTPSVPVILMPPATGTDAAVFVRSSVVGDRIVAQIVTRSTPDLSGAALRVSFPSWLRFDRRDDESGWSAATVHHTKVGPEREVIWVDTTKGAQKGHDAPAAGGESVLTTLYFAHDAQPAAGAGALVIVPQRSELRDAAGKPVAVRYYDQAFDSLEP